MGRRGKTRTSSRGRKGRRSSATQQDAKSEEDRISELPDELIAHILSYVNSKLAVQTMVLSKRWVNIWTTLSCLNFERLISGNHENFVSNFIKYRDQQYVFSDLNIDCCYPEDRKMLTICLKYALSHNVEHLFICNGDLHAYPCLNSALIKTLHLMDCKYLRPMKYWTLPSLTSLYLKNIGVGNKISGFENLKELTLADNFNKNSDNKIITINCPKLQSLNLYPAYQYTLIVSAPSLSRLNYRSRRVPAGFSARGGFPCIRQVHIDIQKKNGDFFPTGKQNGDFFGYLFQTGDQIKLVMQKFISMLNAVRETPVLVLTSETIEGLRRIPNLSEYEPSLLCNLKVISLRGLGLFDMGIPGSTDHVINHLFANSPRAKIIIRRW